MRVIAFIGTEAEGPHLLVYNGDRVDRAIEAVKAAALAGEGRIGCVYQDANGGAQFNRVHRIDYSYLQPAAPQAVPDPGPAKEGPLPPSKRLKEPARV